MNILDALPNDRILSLLLTLQCNAECAHCGTMSGPRVRSRLEADKARNAIVEAAHSGYRLVVFTGGEPLMYGPEIFNLIILAREQGLTTRIVTNGFWAATDQKALRLVKRLRDAGLSEINFSTGDQHVRFVPVEAVIRGARASLDVGLPVSIMIETVRGNALNAEALRENALFRDLLGDQRGKQINFCESPWMPLDENVLLDYPDGYLVNNDNVGAKNGCDSIINTTTVLADGRIMACCGLGTQTIPELEVGNIGRDTFADVDRRNSDDFLKRWIRVEGPEKILAWAAEQDHTIDWENMYAHRCQACKRLYSDPKVRDVILSKHEEKIGDVLLQEWLMHGCAFEQTTLTTACADR